MRQSLLLVIVALFAIGFKCDAKKNGVSFQYKTPAGVSVYSPVAVPANVLGLVDQAIKIQLERMPIEWDKAKSPSDYTIRFIEPQAWNMDGSPAIFEQGVQTAGTVRCVNDVPLFQCSPAQIYLAIPHQAAKNWVFDKYLLNSIWYEAEHRSELANDLVEFNKWATIGDVHPHRP